MFQANLYGALPMPAYVVLSAFILMVLSPCLIALISGERDEKDARTAFSRVLRTKLSRLL